VHGFGLRLNDRGIRIAKINAAASRETFRAHYSTWWERGRTSYWD